MIDGETVGQLMDCAADNAECVKILRLAQSAELDTAKGRAEVADCSLDKSECQRFTGSPTEGVFGKQTGLAEIVGIAATAATARYGIDPSTIVSFEQ